MNTTTAPIIEVRKLRTVITSQGRALPAVDDVSFAIQRGRTFALLGESGCGKSLTALSVMRLLVPGIAIASGEVLLDARDITRIAEKDMRAVRGARIGMIFQEPQSSLNPVMTVGAQVAEAVRAHARLGTAAVMEKVTALLTDVGIPDVPRRLREYPHQMSGGMKQRVMIAIALAGEPDVLIADEPTTALDVTIQAQVLELIQSIQAARGMAILLITHDLGIAANMADEIGVMYAGRIVERGPAKAFVANPQHPYSRKLLAALPGQRKRGAELDVIPGSVPPVGTVKAGCGFANRCDFAMEKCRTEQPGWQQVAQAEVACHLYPQGVPAQPPLQRTAPTSGVPADAATLVQVQDMRVHFPIRQGLLRHTVGHVKAVDGVSLSIKAGGTLALVGESGCGKTTVGKALLQLIPATAGEVMFKGQRINGLSRAAMKPYRKAMQIIFQDPYASMNPRMTIGQIVAEGLVAQQLYTGRAQREQYTDELLRKVGLEPAVKRRYPHEFSGGQRQRICIARALAVQPDLLVCDEPTSALDVSVQAQILNLMKTLQQRDGLGYLFITHNLAVVDYLADDVAVMYLGRIVEFGPVAAVMQTPKHPYTEALLSAAPSIEADGREVIRLQGELPSPAKPPAGCHFHARCPKAMAQCRQAYPQTRQVGAQQVACWLYEA